MPAFTPLWVTDPIEYLLLCRFPHLRVYEDGTKELLATMSLAKKSELAIEVGSYRSELSALTDSELESRVEGARPVEDERIRRKFVYEEEQRPFNQPHGQADFDYWSKMSYWTIDEAVALSLGRNPAVASWKSVEGLLWKSAFAREFSARREVVMRAKTMGQLWEQTTPSTFLAWAGRMNVSVPAELVEPVSALGVQIADWKTLFERQKEFTERANRQVKEEHDAHMAALKGHSESISKARAHQDEMAAAFRGLLDQKDELIAWKDSRIELLQASSVTTDAAQSAKSEKPLHVKERESLLKLVIGMAIGGYGFNPQATRNPTAKEIANDLELRGIALDEDTVRKYLAEARQLLPGDET